MLGAREADRLGIAHGRGGVTRYTDASGTHLAQLATLERVEIGGIVRHQVAALVLTDVDGYRALLGASFLDSVTLCDQGRMLILRDQVKRPR